jgi:hypothetical protein
MRTGTHPVLIKIGECFVDIRARLRFFFVSCTKRPLSSSGTCEPNTCGCRGFGLAVRIGRTQHKPLRLVRHARGVDLLDQKFQSRRACGSYIFFLLGPRFILRRVSNPEGATPARLVHCWISNPTHARSEGRAPVLCSEFTTKAATL